MGFKAGGGVGGVGVGRSPPLCKHIMIRATFPYCKNGDDMMLVFLLHAWMGFTKAGGLGRARPPPPHLQTQRSGQPFPNSKHGDDMMLVFYCTRMGFKAGGGGWGGGEPPPLQTHNDPRNLPLCTKGRT